MRGYKVGLFALSGLLGLVGPSLAQTFEVGPGGVRVYNDRPRVYEERRVYEDRPRYIDRRLCAELRDACEFGPRGEGSCRRYRRTCG